MKKMDESKISKSTIARTILLIIALLNQGLYTYGITPQLGAYRTFTILLIVSASLIAFWKNNSFSKPAIEGDIVKESIKHG